MHDCMREAGSLRKRHRMDRTVSSAFLKMDAATSVAIYQATCEMLGKCRPRAARVLEEAKPDALA